jgi:NAD(P)H dehydrogenase (quinone)
VYYNPGFFADNMISFPETVVQLGQMPNPFGDGLCPWISTGDLGRVAAALLKNPAPHIGQRVHPTGPKSITAKEMAATYAKVTGRNVMVVPVPDWLFRKAVLAADKEFGYDAFMAVQTVFYAQECRKNRFDVGGPTDVVKRLTGREPEEFETIVREHIANSPYKERTFGNWLSAMKKFMALPFTPVPDAKEREALNRWQATN